MGRDKSSPLTVGYFKGAGAFLNMERGQYLCLGGENQLWIHSFFKKNLTHKVQTPPVRSVEVEKKVRECGCRLKKMRKGESSKGNRKWTCQLVGGGGGKRERVDNKLGSDPTSLWMRGTKDIPDYRKEVRGSVGEEN